MCSGTQSQWRLMSAGVIYSDRRILKISRAAEFWTVQLYTYILIYCLKWYQSNSSDNAFESVASSLSLAGAVRRPARTLNRSAGTPSFTTALTFEYLFVYIHFSAIAIAWQIGQMSRFTGHFIIGLKQLKQEQTQNSRRRAYIQKTTILASTHKRKLGN